MANREIFLGIYAILKPLQLNIEYYEGLWAVPLFITQNVEIWCNDLVKFFYKFAQISWNEVYLCI